MTDSIHQVQLDKWLVCSEAAFQAISGFWRSETGTSSLLDWRLTNQMIELVTLDQLTVRLGVLATEGERSVFVVANQADMALLEQLQLHVVRLTIRLVEWSEAPLTAVLSMNAPDQAVLSALHNSPGDVGSLEWGSEPPDLLGYVAALSAWEAACKESNGEGFAAILPAFANSPIPWNAMLKPTSSPKTQIPAANDNWVELVRLAAASKDEDGKAVSLEDPRNKPAQWTLTLSPIDGGPSTLAVFRVNDAAIPSFAGCRVRLRVRGDVIDLGEIDDEGQTEIILPSPVEMQGLAISWDEGE